MEIILLESVFILLTGGAYLAAGKLYRKLRRPYLHTILLSVFFIAVFLMLSGIEYQVYYDNTRLLRFILDVSVVAFGYLLYLHLEFLKKNVWTILLANFIGSLMGVGSVLALSYFLETDLAVVSSLVPKSVTTPLAVEISSRLGGIPSLTAVVVVLCGLSGALMGPRIFTWCRIDSPFARGIALGTSSHGLGTAKALEFGALEGAVGGLSIGLMGLFTSLAAAILY